MTVGLYLYLFRRWALFAILPALVVAASSYLYVQHERKQYTAAALLYVQQASLNNGSPAGNDVAASEALVPTYSQMITSPVIARAADRILSSRYPGYHVADHQLSVSSSSPLSGQGQSNTQLIELAVMDTIPARAADAANVVAHSFVREIKRIGSARLSGGQARLQRQLRKSRQNIEVLSYQISHHTGNAPRLDDVRAELVDAQNTYAALVSAAAQFDVARAASLNTVKVFSPAMPPTDPVGPHPLRSALLSGLLALLLASVLLYAYDQLKDSPRTPEEIEVLLNAPILGTVRQFDTPRDAAGLVTATMNVSPIAEAYRLIRTNIEFADWDAPLRTILVTSCGPAEGKTTTISNLANVFAESGCSVTLVDGDLRRPALHRVFETNEQHGLTNVLVGAEDLNGHGVQNTEYQNLRVVTSGPKPPRPADLIGSPRMKLFLKHLAEQSDLILVDTPPVLAVADAAVLSTIVDGCIIVVDSRSTTRRDLLRTRDALEGVGGRIVGVVINRLNRTSRHYYYHDHQYVYTERQLRDLRRITASTPSG